MKILVLYLCIINILAFSLMGIDKFKARRGLWRIPEKTLFLSALLGGAMGSILGMKLFRHKTKHRSFTIGMPCLLLLNVATLGLFIYWIS